MAGWLDNYGEEENYNDSQTTAPQGFEGDGYSNVGRNYSPAWGGQFQDGGIISIAQTGKKLKQITTNNPADPRLHKYLDSLNLYKGYELSKKYNKQEKYNFPDAPKGKVKYSKSNTKPYKSYEEHLKFSNEYDKRFKKAYDKGGMNAVNADPFLSSKQSHQTSFTKKEDLYKYDPDAKALIDQYEKLSFKEPVETGYWKTPDLYHPTIRETGSYYKGAFNPIFKKPNQEVVYSGNPEDVAKLRQKPYVAGVTNFKPQQQVIVKPKEVKPKEKLVPLQPISRGLMDIDQQINNTDINIPVQGRVPQYFDITDTNNQNFGGGDTSYRVDNLSDLRELPKEQWDRKVTPHYQMGGSVYPVNYVPQAQGGMSMPGSVGFSYARTQGIPYNGPGAKKTMASAQNGQEMQYYREGLDWKPKSISRDGSVIKDDMGYWNPDNWGKQVEINSPYITMENVYEPLIGQSKETGEIKLMKPGQKNIKFGKGTKNVIETPLAKNGLRQEQKSLQNLDNLVNFTNYNNKQPGGWLDQI